MKKNNINLSMQIGKLIAAMFVVFIHFTFPGRFGIIIDCIARFAVPMFFAISGYFSYRINNDKIKKRIIYMMKLNIFALLFYLLITVIEKYIFHNNIFDYLNSIFNLTSLSKWIIINCEPFTGHLWYLAAMLVIYIFYWIYIKFFDQKDVDYKPLYMIGVFLMFIHILLGSNAPASGMKIPYIIYRNALFWGLPLFCLGMFINQYYDRIIKNFNLSTFKIIIIIIFGLLFSLIQYIGIGKTEMPIGMIFTVIGLLLLFIKYPNSNLIKNNFILFIIKEVSLIVYIIHPLVNWPLLKILTPQLCEKEYLYPCIVFIISLIFGILYAIVKYFIKKITNKK